MIDLLYANRRPMPPVPSLGDLNVSKMGDFTVQGQTDMMAQPDMTGLVSPLMMQQLMQMQQQMAMMQGGQQGMMPGMGAPDPFGIDQMMPMQMQPDEDEYMEGPGEGMEEAGMFGPSPEFPGEIPGEEIEAPSLTSFSPRDREQLPAELIDLLSRRPRGGRRMGLPRQARLAPVAAVQPTPAQDEMF